MAMFRILLFVCCVGFALMGCGRIQNERFTGGVGALPPGIELKVAVSETASLRMGTPAEAQITLTENSVPLSGATLTVEGNMTHAGMEPIFATATEVAPGDYRARLEWTMGGEWLLIVHGTLADGTTFEQRFDGLTVQS